MRNSSYDDEEESDEEDSVDTNNIVLNYEIEHGNVEGEASIDKTKIKFNNVQSNG